MDQSYINQINDLLTTVYNDITRVEERELRKSQFKDISLREVHAIDAMTMYEHKTSSQIARDLKVTPGTVTSMVSNLVRKGYVVRMRGNDDRRLVRLGLTRRGRLVYRTHDYFHRHMVQSFIQGFESDQVQMIEKALLNLQAFLEFPVTKTKKKE
ncbi:MarR family transcriptional regulator [Lactobacillus sp. DCY120]|uniref:MarR family transcriptional regulator n=1 Tax=Bombilactobacillus apium TaxID=2675299 RepID=A0A850R3Y1_9LACO|nr:MarR family transcriptional regulator [Bombilactobacillus apium]NVY96681.1 MarR family transcriptional regulator [Bombilactobacillus apium]